MWGLTYFSYFLNVFAMTVFLPPVLLIFHRLRLLRLTPPPPNLLVKSIL